ncbi:MAG: DEAD/DEAH box helicase family protein [Pirellulales bacterium]|nr:DEAD/DEAH box helicase family protein [Pirellulales bacterium]
MSLVPTNSDCGQAICYAFRSIERNSHAAANFRLRWLAKLSLDNADSMKKHVPLAYKTASREDRLGMLAGLLDTDGHQRNGGFDFISKSRRLSNDLAFIARSVGLAAYVTPAEKYDQNGRGGIYWRVSVSGDCSIIPCRVVRKKATPRKQIKDVLRTGFRIETVGEDDYYGFSLSGDGRFLMGDFTVTHNTGKTVVLASVIAEHLRLCKGRAMVIAHREELIFQAAEKIKRVVGVNVDIEMAEMRAASGIFGKAPVVVSSVQTQIAGCDGDGRMTRFDPSEFSLLVIDEAHHAVAPTYRRVIQYYRQNPELKVLGVTATPDRTDEAALGQVFESVAFDYELPDAIHDGWLVPVMQRCVTVDGLDLSQVRTTAGDLNGADLARVMEFEGMLHEIASPTIDIANGRKTLIFAASVAHAERLCEILNRHQSNCARFVCGNTPKEDRRQMFADYAAGRFQFLCNVGVATEGFDEPGIQLVVMARPTQSRALYAQMAGRGTRPLDELAHRLNDVPDAAARRAMIAGSDKPHCEIVDFVGNAGKHKLITTADILGGRYNDAVVERARKKAEESSGPVDMDMALQDAERDIAEEKARARRAALRVKAKYSVNTVNPFDVLDLQPRRERGWDKGRQPSEKMIAFLDKSGVPTRGLNFTQANQLIGEIINRRDQQKCTYKQARILARYGYRTDVSFHQAREVIDAIAANGWRRVDTETAPERKVTVY